MTITVPNPDNEFDMPIYEGDPEKCATLVPGFYPCVATYTFDRDDIDDVEEHGILVTAGTVLDGITVERPFYMAPDACNYGPFWCHETAPHSHPGSFWA